MLDGESEPLCAIGTTGWFVEGCAVEVPCLSAHVDGEQVPPIDLRTAAPHCEPSVAFFHPVMQEALIGARRCGGGSCIASGEGDLTHSG